MNKYVTPSKDGDNFTANKHYKIMYEYTNDRVLVLDDKGNSVIVRIDGEPSARLNWGGKFSRCSELLERALTTAENVEKLVEEVKPEVEAQRRVESVGGFVSRHVMVNLDSMAERFKREAEQHKADLLKAEAVIDQLYDLFPNVRNHEQLVSAIKSAKIFSDAFIELQKIK